MRQLLSLILLALPTLIWAGDESKERQLSIESYLEIGALDQALSLAQESSLSFPDQEAFSFLLIRSLSKKKMLKEALSSFSLFAEKNPPSPALIEEISWAILHEGARSQSIEQKVNALLGAAFSQDAKGLPILLKSLHSSNYTIRYIATELSANWPDYPIKKELLQKLRQDPNPLIRQTAARSLAHLQAEEAIPPLKTFLQESSSDEEKKSAQKALLKLTKAISQKISAPSSKIQDENSAPWPQPSSKNSNSQTITPPSSPSYKIRKKRSKSAP